MTEHRASVTVELVLRTVDGDELAFARLCRIFDRMLEHHARRYYAPGLDHDDLKQEARIALHVACLSWDATSAAFPGFASFVIDRRLGTAVKMAQRAKHSPLNASLRLEQHAGNQDDPDGTLQDTLPGPAHHDPAVIAQARADLATITRTIHSQLTDTEWLVVTRRLNGATLHEAGHGLGRSRQGAQKTADNALCRARHKISQALAA